MTCLGLAALGATAFLPFAGALTALMAAITSANLYGQDGTALWLTLLVPGSERADVRRGQLAWLALFAPMTLVLTAAGIAAGGRPDCGRGRWPRRSRCSAAGPGYCRPWPSACQPPVPAHETARTHHWGTPMSSGPPW